MNNSQVIDEEKSFLKRLFNWKYLLLLIGIQSTLMYIDELYGLYGKSGQQNPLVLFIIGIMYYLSRRLSTNKDKTLNSALQWTSIFMYALITILIYVMVYTKAGYNLSQSLKVEYIMTRMLQEKRNLPIKVNEYFELFNVSKIDDHTIARDARYFDYTREEILADYGNDLNVLKKEMYEAELKAGCSAGQDMYALGIAMVITYFGKDNKSIVRTRLDDKACRPYYAKHTR